MEPEDLFRRLFQNPPVKTGREPDEYEVRSALREAQRTIEGTEERWCECGRSFEAPPKNHRKWCCERCRAAFAAHDRQATIYLALRVLSNENHLSGLGGQALAQLWSRVGRRPQIPRRCNRYGCRGT